LMGEEQALNRGLDGSLLEGRKQSNARLVRKRSQCIVNRADEKERSLHELRECDIRGGEDPSEERLRPRSLGPKTDLTSRIGSIREGLPGNRNHGPE